MLRRLVGAALASLMLAVPISDARAADAGSPGPSSKAAAATQEGFRSLVTALSGSWVLAIRYEPPQEGAPSAESKGTVRWYTAVDGQVLLEDEAPAPRQEDGKLLDRSGGTRRRRR